MKALACALALVAGPTSGAEVGPVARALLDHMAQGINETRVGDWVTYQLDKGDGRPTFWRLAVVGEEMDRRGRPAYWIEMEWGTHPALNAPLAQMRMLVAKDTGLGRDGITRIFWGQGADRPSEVEEASVSTRPVTARPSSPAPDAQAAVRSGPESMLMTEAGSMAAMPVEAFYRQTVVKRLWVSRQIPLLHLAKLELPPIHHSLEVRGYGIDAKARMILPDPKAPKIRLETGGEP